MRPRPGRSLITALAATFAVLIGGVASACSTPEPQTIEVVVPAGTQDRLDAGETVDVMPARIEMRVGDTLVIRNDDSVRQSVGPYQVEANRSIRLTYGTPGTFEGYCPLSEGERYEIVIT